EQNIDLPARLAGEKPEPEWVRTVTERLGIETLLHRKPHELSGGQQQRVAVARALVTRPAVVFADEPTGNLDSVSGAEVMRLLAAAVREYGQTVIMVTHDPGLAAYADRVIMLADGRPVADLADPGPEAVADALLHLTRDAPDAPLAFREQEEVARGDPSGCPHSVPEVPACWRRASRSRSRWGSSSPPWRPWTRSSPACAPSWPASTAVSAPWSTPAGSTTTRCTAR